MTGNFFNTPRTGADSAGVKLDPGQKIARWPEWSVEQWEEIERAEEVPSGSSGAGANEPEKIQDVADSKAIKQVQPPLGHAAKVKSKPLHSVSRTVLGIAVGLLFVGGHFDGFKMSSAEVPVRQAVVTAPSPSPTRVDIADLSQPTEPAAVPQAAALQPSPAAIPVPLHPPAKGADGTEETAQPTQHTAFASDNRPAVSRVLAHHASAN